MKALDQDGRASLRKHGVRFGQYTVFLPLLLKPAPTRLRLVLWSLAQGFDGLPRGAAARASSPSPRCRTRRAGYYPRAGYRLAGERAIRIDMLERLADMIRASTPAPASRRRPRCCRSPASASSSSPS